MSVRGHSFYAFKKNFSDIALELVRKGGACLRFKTPLEHKRSLSRALGNPEDGEPIDCQDAMGPRLKRFYTQDEVNACYEQKNVNNRASFPTKIADPLTP